MKLFPKKAVKYFAKSSTLDIWQGSEYAVANTLLIVAFHIKTSFLICFASRMHGFYMKCNTRLEWINKAVNKAKES